MGRQGRSFCETILFKHVPFATARRGGWATLRGVEGMIAPIIDTRIDRIRCTCVRVCGKLQSGSGVGQKNVVSVIAIISLTSSSSPCSPLAPRSSSRRGSVIGRYRLITFLGIIPRFPTGCRVASVLSECTHRFQNA